VSGPIEGQADNGRLEALEEGQDGLDVALERGLLGEDVACIETKTAVEDILGARADIAPDQLLLVLTLHPLDLLDDGDVLLAGILGAQVVEILRDAGLDVVEIVLVIDADEVEEHAAGLCPAPGFLVAGGDAVEEAIDLLGTGGFVLREEGAVSEVLGIATGAEEGHDILQDLRQEAVRHRRETTGQDVEVVLVGGIAHQVHDVGHIAEHDVVMVGPCVENRLVAHVIHAAINLGEELLP